MIVLVVTQRDIYLTPTRYDYVPLPFKSLPLNLFLQATFSLLLISIPFTYEDLYPRNRN